MLNKSLLSMVCLAIFLVGISCSVNAMTGAAHILGGAASSQVAGSAEGAFMAGLASHVLLDSVPHWEYSPTAQVLLAVGASIVVKQKYDETGDMRLIAGAVGGFLPDVENVLKQFGLVKERHFPSHTGISPHGHPRNIWQGVWLETGMVGLLLGLSF